MTMPLTKRFLGFIIFFFYFVISYFIVQKIALWRDIFYSVQLPSESQIPFIAESFWIYITAYIFPLVIVVSVREKILFLRSLKAFGATSLVHYFFFLIFPVHYDLRPEIFGDSFQIQCIRLFYQLDAPINAFPSIHVSYAFITAFCILRSNALKCAWPFFAWATAIAASTLTFKQHYALDILAALLIAKMADEWILKQPKTNHH